MNRLEKRLPHASKMMRSEKCHTCGKHLYERIILLKCDKPLSELIILLTCGKHLSGVYHM
jgi:hypothetical protein